MPTGNQIRNALRKSDDFTNGEIKLLYYQIGECGGFFLALFDAMSHADGHNLAKLRLGFPEEVAAFQRWTQGDLAQAVTAIPEHDTKGERLQRRPKID